MFTMLQMRTIGYFGVGSLLLLCLALLPVQGFAQNMSVNLDGSAPDPSAMLDISDTTKGLLVPRMTQSQRNNIVSPAVGLLIFQTDVNPGFRWYNGSSWNSPGASTTWSLEGNSGVTTPSNFLGTTDSTDLLLKTNGQPRMVVAANGNLGIGQSTPISPLHIGDNLQLTGSPGLASVAGWLSNNFHTDGTSVFYTSTGTADGLVFLDNGVGLYHWELGSAGDTLNDDPNSFAILNDNGFCINCDNADSALTVEGGISADNLRLLTGAATGRTLISDALGRAVWTDPAWTTSGNNIYRSNSLGTVSIGTSVPNTFFQLDVVVASSLSRSRGILIDNNYNSTLTKVGLEIQINNSGSADKYGILSLIDGTSSSSADLYGYYAKLSPTLGTNYMYYGTDNGSGSGNTFGIYMEAEDHNYLSSSLSIGTTEDVNELNVNGFATFLSHSSISHPTTSHLAIGNFTGTSLLQSASTGSTPGEIEIQASQIKLSTGSSSFASTVERLTILSDGKVGIGDSSPSAMFTVGNGDKFQVDGAAGDVTFTDDNASITFPAATATNSPMIQMFASGFNNANRMVIAHSSSFSNYGLQYEDANDEFHFIGNGIQVLTVELVTQRVGIGTANPSSLLEVNGSASKPGGGSWSTSSDARLKNIQGDYSLGLKEILALRPVQYRYQKDNARNHPSDTTHVGLIAQEVQKVFPEAVTEEEDGYLSLNNDPILIAYINAIKELNAQNEALDAENEALSLEVESLRQEVALIRQLMEQYLKNVSDLEPQAKK